MDYATVIPWNYTSNFLLSPYQVSNPYFEYVPPPTPPYSFHFVEPPPVRSSDNLYTTANSAPHVFDESSDRVLVRTPTSSSIDIKPNVSPPLVTPIPSAVATIVGSLNPKCEGQPYVLPIFDGSDPREWILKVGKYFNGADIENINLAGIHFEGKAKTWYRCFYQRTKELIGWKEFLHELLVRFDSYELDIIGYTINPLGLQQFSSIIEYEDTFLQTKELAEFIYGFEFTEEMLVHNFISGLKEEIREVISLWSPKTLQGTINLAKYEELQVKERMLFEANEAEQEILKALHHMFDEAKSSKGHVSNDERDVIVNRAGQEGIVYDRSTLTQDREDPALVIFRDVQPISDGDIKLLCDVVHCKKQLYRYGRAMVYKLHEDEYGKNLIDSSRSFRDSCLELHIYGFDTTTVKISVDSWSYSDSFLELNYYGTDNAVVKTSVRYHSCDHNKYLDKGEQLHILVKSFYGDSHVSNDVVYWTIDVSDASKLVNTIQSRQLCFVELKNLLVFIDWANQIVPDHLAEYCVVVLYTKMFCEGSTHVTVEEVKKRISDLLREYVESGDTSEAHRCIRQLGVAFFHHEVVKRALVLAMETRTAEPAILKLLQEAAYEGLISSSQMLKGFTRLAESLDDLALDIPSAKTLFESRVPQAVAGEWLDASFLKSLENNGEVHGKDSEKLKLFVSIIKEHVLLGMLQCGIVHLHEELSTINEYVVRTLYDTGWIQVMQRLESVEGVAVFVPEITKKRPALANVTNHQHGSENGSRNLMVLVKHPFKKEDGNAWFKAGKYAKASKRYEKHIPKQHSEFISYLKYLRVERTVEKEITYEEYALFYKSLTSVWVEHLADKRFSIGPTHDEKWQTISKVVKNFHQPTEAMLKKVVIALGKEMII